MITVEVKPVYDGKILVATQKKVRLFGVVVFVKKILHPDCAEGEYYYHPNL